MIAFRVGYAYQYARKILFATASGFENDRDATQTAMRQLGLQDEDGRINFDALKAFGASGPHRFFAVQKTMGARLRPGNLSDRRRQLHQLHQISLWNSGYLVKEVYHDLRRRLYDQFPRLAEPPEESATA